MSALTTAKRYFDLSNESDFDGITELFSDQTRYSSQNTGEYVGRDSIITMQRQFHGQFKAKQWVINGTKEVTPGLAVIDYTFSGEKTDGSKVEGSGLEYIHVRNGKITQIEIRAK
jgi:ketosteroid isomerase-like protein